MTRAAPSLKSLIRRANTGDRTVNTSGETNMMPRSTLRRDAATDLIDGFISDGWHQPADRENEIACLLQHQLAVERRHLAVVCDSIAQRNYAAAWVTRWLQDAAP